MVEEQRLAGVGVVVGLEMVEPSAASAAVAVEVETEVAAAVRLVEARLELQRVVATPR